MKDTQIIIAAHKEYAMPKDEIYATTMTSFEY